MAPLWYGVLIWVLHNSVCICHLQICLDIQTSNNESSWDFQEHKKRYCSTQECLLYWIFDVSCRVHHATEQMIRALKWKHLLVGISRLGSFRKVVKKKEKIQFRIPNTNIGFSGKDISGSGFYRSQNLKLDILCPYLLWITCIYCFQLQANFLLFHDKKQHQCNTESAAEV